VCARRARRRAAPLALLLSCPSAWCAGAALRSTRCRCWADTRRGGRARCWAGASAAGTALPERSRGEAEGRARCEGNAGVRYGGRCHSAAMTRALLPAGHPPDPRQGMGGALGRVPGRPGCRTGQGQTERVWRPGGLCPRFCPWVLPPQGVLTAVCTRALTAVSPSQGLVLLRERTHARVPGADSRPREPWVCSSDLGRSRPPVCTLASPLRRAASLPPRLPPPCLPCMPRMLPCLTCAAGGSGRATTSSTGRATRPRRRMAQMEMDMSIGCGRWYRARRQGAGDRAAGPGRAAGSKGEQRRSRKETRAHNEALRIA
jgi:hypothetical protein